LKNAHFVLAFLLCSTLFSQNTNSLGDCGTRLPKNYSKWRSSNLQNNVANLQHDRCVNKKFSIVFYIVADSNGNTGGITPATLTSCINNLNNAFSRICVSFMNCSTVVIPHHPFNRWTMDTTDNTVRQMWWTKNTLNLYLPDSIVGFPVGYSSMPGGPGSERIVVEKASITSNTPIHEMGHFFGLPHTWDEIGAPANPPPPGGGSNEFVRRTNCYTNGDGFCDTEADPYPLNKDLTKPCQHAHGAQDGYGDYYISPVDNYMTYFKGCNCRFTQEQYNLMANTVVNQLLYMH
jgi:hypothetical protein